MTSERQLAANRQNALRSTVPRTPIAPPPTTRYPEAFNIDETNPMRQPIPSSQPLGRGGTGAILDHASTPRYHARTTKIHLRTTISHTCAHGPGVRSSQQHYTASRRPFGTIAEGTMLQ
jgi:hypothetical protein